MVLAKRPSALLAAVIALAMGGVSACSSSGSTGVTVPNQTPTAVQPSPSQESTPNPESDAPPKPASQPTAQSPELPLAPNPSALVWTEVSLNQVLGIDETSTTSLETVGDGRVLALTYNDRGIDAAMVSENGATWSPISVSAGFSPWSIDITGDRWLIQGWDTLKESPTTEILYSDDQGQSWAEVAVDLGTQRETTWIADAIVAEEDILVVALRDGAHPGDDEAPNDETAYGPSNSSVLFFLSDGGPAEFVAEYPGWFTGGHGASDGFHLILHDEGAIQLLASPDGHQWTATTVDVAVSDSALHEVWTNEPTDGRFRVERFEGVYGSDQVLTLPDEVGWVTDLAVGPAGVAAVAGPELDYGEYDPYDFLIGRSLDGTDWQWQSLQEAFGLTERSAYDNSVVETEVAVGYDFMIAKVQIHVFPETDPDMQLGFGAGDGQTDTEVALLSASEISSSPPRWFIAKVG